ncbi:MAG: TadE/TadG family type IV pilus assembly protein [Bryobacteraceae bacterium]
MRRRGSSLVESALVLLLFIVLLAGILDLAQILFFQHFLTERAQTGARYAALHADNLEAVRNMVVYNSASAPGDGRGLFGLTAAMVTVTRHDAGTGSDRVEVSISGYPFAAVSLWLPRSLDPGPFRAVRPVEAAGTVN